MMQVAKAVPVGTDMPIEAFPQDRQPPLKLSLKLIASIAINKLGHSVSLGCVCVLGGTGQQDNFSSLQTHPQVLKRFAGAS